MPTRAEIVADAETLTGRRTGVRYRDLARMLRRAGAEVVGQKGSHRTWARAGIKDHLTIIEGSGDVLPPYIRKTREYLLAIAEAL